MHNFKRCKKRDFFRKISNEKINAKEFWAVSDPRKACRNRAFLEKSKGA